MIISFVFATNHLPSKNVTLHYHYGTPKKGFQANIVFKQITIQSKRYTSTTYNLQVLRLQLVQYTYTSYSFQAINNSINNLHLRKTYNWQVLKLQSACYMYTTHNVQANNNSVNMLHLHNL